MLSCRQATERISQDMDGELSLWNRIGLRVHLLICRGCRVTRQQLAFLGAATRSWRQLHGGDHD